MSKQKIQLIILIGILVALVFAPRLIFALILLVGVVWALSKLTGTHFKDWIDPSKWKSVLISWLRKLLNYLDSNSNAHLEPHEIEQYAFRILACPKCVDKKSCISCTCNTMGKMNVRQEECSADRWAPFKDKETWEEYKKQYNVKFTLTIDGVNIDDIDVEL